MKKIELIDFCYLNSFKTTSSAKSGVEKLYTYLNISIRNPIVCFRKGKWALKIPEPAKIQSEQP